jgi:hypothetical protein
LGLIWNLGFGYWNLIYCDMISLAERYLKKFRYQFIGWRKGMNGVRLTATVKKAG